MGARAAWTELTAHRRSELLAIYAEVDLVLAEFSCDDSSECCRFGITGREPYPTGAEVAELDRAVRSLGGAPPRAGRSLPLADRACPFLGNDGRCRVYASRPFGCRTFFCDRAEGPGKPPRKEIQRLARKVADLSARAFPGEHLPRPLTRVFPPT
jgi:Fe-S-cluster containining protein